MAAGKLEIKIRQVDDGYVYTIDGVNKLGGERVCKNTEEFQMLKKIGEALLGFKIKVERE